MSRTLFHQGAEDQSVTEETVGGLLERGEFFWLDIEGPDATDIGLLSDLFRFHPLAVEDSQHFGQRPKIDDYEDFTLLVVFGAGTDEDRLVEVHCFYSERFLVTVHRDEFKGFADVRRRLGGRMTDARSAILLHRIIDGLVDSFFPILSDFDDRIEQLEDDIFNQASDEQLQEVLHLKRLLTGMRRVVSPQRDLVARLQGDSQRLLGISGDDGRYFRDVYDHLIRISEMIDSHRDLLNGVMDVHLSTVSNRLNGVMKQLAIIATIFLPLTFITGFFGQNFSYLVQDVIGGKTAFFVFGIGLDLAAIVFLVLFFRRRGWM